MAARRSSALPSQVHRRDRIVAVAVRLFSEEEYEDVSVDELCRQADVAKGLVFYYFGDKRGLFAAALEYVWNELAAYQQPRPDEVTATDRMHGFLRRHFEYVKKHPKRFSILMMSGHSNPDVRAIVLRARKQATSGITASLGCPTNPPPRLRQAVGAWSHFVDSLALDWMANRDTDVDEMCDMGVQVLVASVRSANGQQLDVESELDALAQVMEPVMVNPDATVAATSSGPRSKPRARAKSVARGKSSAASAPSAVPAAGRRNAAGASAG